jgi:hypothetical protein
VGTWVCCVACCVYDYVGLGAVVVVMLIDELEVLCV